MVSKEAITVLFPEQYPNPGEQLIVALPSRSEPDGNRALSLCLLGSRTKDPVFWCVQGDQICDNNSPICPAQSKRCGGVQCLFLGSAMLEVSELQPAVGVHS